MKYKFIEKAVVTGVNVTEFEIEADSLDEAKQKWGNAYADYCKYLTIDETDPRILEENNITILNDRCDNYGSDNNPLGRNRNAYVRSETDGKLIQYQFKTKEAKSLDE